MTDTPTQTTELSVEWLQLKDYAETIKWGKLTIVIQNGIPVVIEEGVATRKLGEK